MLGSSPMSPPGGGNLLALLRERTREEHEAIEKTLDFLVRETLTRELYRHTLERFHGYYQPLEERLRHAAAIAGSEVDLGWHERTPLLAFDLQALGRSDPAGLPRCDDLPDLDSAAAVLGCLYVIEGSSLGGQVISRHLRATLGITPETGGRFFHGSGEHTGQQWKLFLARLSGFAATAGAHERVVEAATATFRTLRKWCERDTLSHD